MVVLRRTVRVVLNPGVLAGDGRSETGPAKAGFTKTGSGGGFSGKPAPRGLARYYEFEAACRGEPNGATGYLVDIKTIDRAVRETVVPLVERACVERPEVEPAALLLEMVGPLREALEPRVLCSVTWRVTPWHSVALEGSGMDEGRVLLRQRFDFAAAHRLHAAGLSEEENRRVFGKCNNPSGHGHNYQVEPCVAVRAGRVGGLDHAGLHEVVDRVLIEPFDHTHLNEDTSVFGGDGGVNPSVENIARVFFALLGPAVRELDAEAAVVSVTVWETDRTCCTYPG